MRSKGGCSGVRSAVSEPGRIPRSPTLRSMGNKAAHDTGTATEESATVCSMLSCLSVFMMFPEVLIPSYNRQKPLTPSKSLERVAVQKS